MSAPSMSAHFASRKPSVIRAAQIEYLARTDGAKDLNVAIGNVSLPMHPVMQERMRTLGESGSPFADGVVQYSLTKGEAWSNDAFMNIIASSGFSTDGLYSQVTDGGSQAMELLIVGCCGPAGSEERPLMLIDAAYTNYNAFASRLGRKTVSISRSLDQDGRFEMPAMDDVRAMIEKTRPGALVVIPYDNPTGQLYEREAMVELAKLCVEYDMWMISDEAYRELHYVGDEAISVWGITDDDAPGITGRRISIETSSKVWNACGLRIGALVTDNADFHARAVAENTAGLCSNIIGQWIFGGLAGESHENLQAWYGKQREYYRGMLNEFTTRLQDLLPGVIISRPDASLYSVVEVRDLVPADFDALEFVLWSAREGFEMVDGEKMTLLTAPMAGFYSCAPGEENPGRTQMRIAYVETPERMRLVPGLLAGLLKQYLARQV